MKELFLTLRHKADKFQGPAPTWSIYNARPGTTPVARIVANVDTDVHDCPLQLSVL